MGPTYAKKEKMGKVECDIDQTVIGLLVGSILHDK